MCHVRLPARLPDNCISFEEMPTNSFVESGFWCFDALFVPQLHPARELHDTFYLSGKYLVTLLMA